MTEPNKRWLGWAKDVTTTAYSVVGTALILVGFIAWFSGGWKPQTRVDISELTNRVSALEASRDSFVQALSNVQHTQVDNQIEMGKQLQVVKDQILDRLSQMPRTSDFASEDGRLTGLEQRMNHAEADISNLKGRFEQQHEPYRNPPGR